MVCAGGRAIAGDHADARHPCGAERADRARRIGTQFIGEQERADGPFVDGEEHHQSRAPRGAARGPQRPCVGRTMSKDDVVGTGAHAFAFDKAIEAGTGGLAHVLGHRQRQAAVQRRGHDRRGDHVMRGLLERGAEPQDLVGMFVGRNLDRQQARTAHRQRAGLVEQDRMGPRQRLERSSAFDQNAAPRSLRDTRNEGDRCRQDERAGRCRNQHGEASDNVTGEKPSNAGHGERERQEEQRVAIGEPHERRLGGLRSVDQSQDARVGALTSGR